MTHTEVFNMIMSAGFPAAYDHFPEDTAKAPPYICYYYPASDDFPADNCNYVKKEHI